MQTPPRFFVVSENEQRVFQYVDGHYTFDDDFMHANGHTSLDQAIKANSMVSSRQICLGAHKIVIAHKSFVVDSIILPTEIDQIIKHAALAKLSEQEKEVLGL